jgi:hypothetical protein
MGSSLLIGREQINMNRYLVIAQSYTSTHRISKTLEAYSDIAVLRLVSGELESAGFYPISIELVYHI